VVREKPLKGAESKRYLLTGLTGFFGFIVFTLSGRKRERQSRFAKQKPARKSDDAFCLSSGKAKNILSIL
jgi:hypothetical protein